MSRPSKNIDQLLIKAGKDLALEQGLAGLKVRRVAARAKVNLGMFHYHFKTKEEFFAKVLQSLYEDFFGRFQLESSGPGDPLERLRRALVALGTFARDHRRLFLLLMIESCGGNKTIQRFVKANVPRHIGIIFGLLQECRKRGGIVEAEFPFLISFLMCSIGMPSLVVGMLEKSGAREVLGMPLTKAAPQVLSDEAVALRVDLALRAITTSKTR